MVRPVPEESGVGGFVNIGAAYLEVKTNMTSGNKIITFGDDTIDSIFGSPDLKFDFIKTGDFKGIGELYVNGRKVDTVDMLAMHISTFSLSETFDIGRDTGTPVSAKYKSPFPFKGRLDKVVVTLTD
ncbi:MAG: hypothetical protein ACYS76_07805 [Planctomycetota bacterium]